MRRLALVLVAFFALAAPASAQSDVVATVDDEPITLEQYEHWYAIAGKAGSSSLKPRPGMLREQVMQLLISYLWIRGEAERQGVKVTPEQVRRQFREQKRASFPNHAQYEKFLRDSGQTTADIMVRVELDILSSRIRERVTREQTNVTRGEVRRYYRLYRHRFAQPERRDLLVVLTKTRRTALAARARIEAGEPWATVAKDLSIDPASKRQGGRLPAVAEGQQQRRLDRAFFSAKRGELGGPVRTRLGYVVFTVTKVTPATQQSFRQARATIVQLLRSREEQASLDRFVRTFTKRWRARTICSPGYLVSDCANGPDPKPLPEVPAAAASGP